MPDSNGALSRAFDETNRAIRVSGSGTSVASVTRIDQQVKGSAGATFDFAAIPATYESLILEVMGRSTAAATAVNLLLRINGDSSAIYDIQDINGASATLTAFATTAGTSARVGAIAAGNATAGKVGVARIQVPNYARTVFHKVFQSDSAFFQDESSGYNKDQAVGLWRSTAAIARLTLSLSSGNFDIGSVATLYGVGSPL